jgi:hypothetical protein
VGMIFYEVIFEEKKTNIWRKKKSFSVHFFLMEKNPPDFFFPLVDAD